MKKKIAVLCLSIISATAYAQDFHELGLGFSSLRIWNIDAPVNPLQDLKYYYAPHFSYNYYFDNERFVIGLAVGMARETGNIESSFNSISQSREDLRKSLHYQISGGVNIFKNQTRFLQLTAGARAIRTYYFQHFSERLYENGGSSFGGYEITDWKSPRYSAFFSVGYHQSLINDFRRRNSLSLRVAWDFEYQLPTYYGISADGAVNNFASFKAGPSISLVWRIRGKKNRGLF
jgi:hypothetical protein